MKLYDNASAPNPRRVRIFLAEKGVEVSSVQVDIAAQENRKPDFLAKNPLGGVPVLELDDGSYLSETVAICRYFDEGTPEPALFGAGAAGRAKVEMWNRRMELEILQRIFLAFQNTHEFFKGRMPQAPEYGEIAKTIALARLGWLDTELASRAFVAGDDYTIADITALVGIDFGRVVGIRIAPEHENLKRWHDDVSARPSAKA
jgi:glutathione S-transferase